MEWLKKASLFLSVLLIICYMTYTLPWRQKMNITLQGVQSRIGDKNYAESVSITVNGDYKHYLFKDDTFNGTISIDKYDFTSDGSFVSLRIRNKNSALLYMNVVDGKPIHKPLGTIYCTPGFKELLICVSEPIDSTSKSWHAENGLFISAPSENRSQAIDIAKNVSEKSLANWFR